ncbi:helix-turn-helix transcriptional regulator [Tropicimonas sp. TH_r6]|uniref:helix-turn-helix transcriptional regulator n=1 Tax=Tropicimonas sp. TH_r6 TaxID=3082085 RepID=UPI0029542C82|nr:helix-turn-helix transcriptional regulator [Tropicimonas sp. TH_r6]MDV7145949.1 helix-turn-helix transcriptional regulator [Tropicimonas sp. TH_r6]
MAFSGENGGIAPAGEQAGCSRMAGTAIPWNHATLRHIEDLSDAVRGAGFQVVQLTRQTVTGSLVHRDMDGILLSSGRIGGRVTIGGALSEDKISIAVGLRIAPGSQLWHQDIRTGVVGVFRPGDVHEAQYLPGSLYVTATLTMDRLEEEAAKIGLVLDDRQLGETGFKLPETGLRNTDTLYRKMARVHAGGPSNMGIDGALLDHLILQLAREPHAVRGPAHERGYARIVSMAREFIDANLHSALSVDDVAGGALTSRRTLYRAFQKILGQTPHDYLRTLRLHRMRQTLLEHSRSGISVTWAANTWGLDQLGRTSRWYRDQFGELPSQTLTHTSRATASQPVRRSI